MIRAVALLFALTSCVSSGAEETETSPFIDASVQEQPASIGFFLTELDASLRVWSNLRNSATSHQDLRTLRTLERELTQRTAKRQADLEDQLQSPSPKNRQVAVIALGFTGDLEVMGSLTLALTDRNPAVVQNALLGLGILAAPDTPLAPLCSILGSDAEARTRNNAAFAMLAVVSAGGRDECVVPSCRAALIDPAPGVRVQVVSVLGTLVDPGSIETLGDLLYDEIDLVAHAAAAALGNIGRKSLPDKGRVGRLFISCLERVEPRLERRIFDELARMSEVNYGDDVELWTEWAFRLP
ncbi:MAG: HEAT repeat domain-containing protein [Planctomycetota bacterium]|nr:HEAT repeat domain-containing protein [Planctomycetota bacterium]